MCWNNNIFLCAVAKIIITSHQIKNISCEQRDMKENKLVLILLLSISLISWIGNVHQKKTKYACGFVFDIEKNQLWLLIFRVTYLRK